MSKTFMVPRNEGETWLAATLRHAAGHGHGAISVMAVFSAHQITLAALASTTKEAVEEGAAIATLLELDITPLAREGISGT